MAVACALLWANSPWGEVYRDLRHLELGPGFGGEALQRSLRHWVNDFLMAIFFLQVGLEIREEIHHGVLRHRRQAILVAITALGGMVVPVAIYLIFALPAGQGIGWGIAMATDIAFVVGLMALAGGDRLGSLKVFLLGMAIVDDLGAIAVIAIAYSREIEFTSLLLALGPLALAGLYGRIGGQSLWIYAAMGCIAWYFMASSGVHATVTGVLLAATMPVQESKERPAPAARMEALTRPVVLLVIMPVFALFNAGISPEADIGWLTPVSLGVFFGLLVGKPLGIMLFAWSAVRLRFADLPDEVRWWGMVGISFLAGVGFTMSLFITNLAFEEDRLGDQARIAVLAASLLAAVIGLLLLRRHARHVEAPEARP